MSLVSELKKIDKGKLFSNSAAFTTYDTGFVALNHLCGFRVNIDGMEKLVTGIIGGRFITIVGYSGVGKTTFADQLCWSIVNDWPAGDEEAKRKFKEWGMFIHCDIEQTGVLQRIYDICGVRPDSEDAQRILLKSEDIYIEDVLKMIDLVCQAKQNAGDDAKYEIDGSVFGESGKVKYYVPTVFLLDSLPTFTSKEVNDTTLEGQMSTNREVAQISQFYSKCLQRLHKYNITVVAINHIKTKLKINQYEPDKPQLMLIRDGESMPRGQAPIYLASYLFRINASGAKASRYTKEENGFDGYYATLQVTKTKTSFIGGTLPIVFNKEIGYDPIYSLYEYANSIGMVDGRNPNLFIKGAESYKFSKKNFRDKFLTDEAFRVAVYAALKPSFESLIGTTSDSSGNTMQVPIKDLLTDDGNGNLVPVGIVEKSDSSGLKLV